MKKCRICFSEKPFSFFYKSQTEKDGYRSSCIGCWKILNKRTPEQNREYRAKNLEKIRSNDRDRIKPNHKKKQKSEYDKKWRKQTYEERRNWQLNRFFGISIHQYNEMAKKQRGVCAICSDICNNKKNKSLCVDHCHKTGKIRGLLCDKCNRGIGLLRDSSYVLRQALLYIERAR